MTPLEIFELSKRSEQLKRALSLKSRTLWRFLREQVEPLYTLPPGAYSCERCAAEIYPTLESPYNACVPGWCIDCVLFGYWHDLPRYVSPGEQAREEAWRKNNGSWRQIWPPEPPEDYDGPPIAWG